MSRLSTLAALLLVALWLPATLHCQLEGAGLDEFFSCASHASADDDNHAHPDGCTDSVCQTVESGEYSFTKQRITLAQPLASACLYHLCLLQLSAPTPARVCVSLTIDPVPPWQPSWHFVRRTALPARAPDLLA